MIENTGNIDLPDDANIPVNSFIMDPNESNSGKWEWVADNFMPRKNIASENGYSLVADTKEEILAWVRKYVVPLYEKAKMNLEEEGENYYWER